MPFMILGLFRTKDEVKHVITTEENTPIKEFLPSLPSEAQPHKYLLREYDNSERNFRLHGSLKRCRFSIPEKFVSS